MKDTNQKINGLKVISYAGAFIALLIGSGFATGQELMQYFASYGVGGFVGIGLCFILFTITGLELIYAGYTENFNNPNDVYKYIGGEKLGRFFDIFSIFFLFLSFTVMVAGASATAVEYYDAPYWLGGVILACLAVVTVISGLGRIVDVIGSIGPLIVILTIIVGVISIIINFDSIGEANQNLLMAREIGVMQVASTHFILAALSYVGFCLIWLAAFVSGIGAKASSMKEGYYGITLGAFGFTLACFIMTFAIYLSIDKLHDSQIPVLILSSEIHPWLGFIFSIIIFLGIFTTSVPLLWNVVARFTTEGTNKYRILSVVLGILGIFIGVTIDFSELVNIVYVINGYIGAVLMVLLIMKFVSRQVSQ